jgi:hypothetical protein
MWISPQNQALQAQSAAIIALLISLFGFAWKRNRFWFSFLLQFSDFTHPA